MVVCVSTACLASAQPSARVPFKDLNQIEGISGDADRIRFESPNGWLAFRRADASWEVGAYEEPFTVCGDPSVLDVHAAKSSGILPGWYEAPAHGSVLATAGKDRRWVLVARWDERSARADDVVDVAERTIYRLPSLGSRTMGVSDEDIWIARSRGVTRIDRSSGRRIDYRALPGVQRISGWVEHRGVLYVASPDGEIVTVGSEGELSLLELPDTRLREETGARSPDLGWNFTNPVVQAEALYVGAFATYPFEARPQSGSALLRFDLTERRWSVRRLPPRMAIRHLLVDRGRIWLFGGGRPDAFDEIAFVLPDDRIVDVGNCTGAPVASWRWADEGTDLGTAFLSMEGNVECRIELDGTAPPRRTALGEPPHTPEGYVLTWSAIAPRTIGADPSPRVRPSVVSFEGRPVEVLRFPE